MITILCDNAIVSEYHLATLLYLCKHFRLNFQICPYCAHHAESIADSHVVHVKPWKASGDEGYNACWARRHI